MSAIPGSLFEGAVSRRLTEGVTNSFRFATLNTSLKEGGRGALHQGSLFEGAVSRRLTEGVTNSFRFASLNTSLKEGGRGSYTKAPSSRKLSAEG